MLQIEPEAPLEQLEQERRDQTAGQRVPRPHRAVRHHDIEEGEAKHGEREGEQPRQIEPVAGDDLDTEPLDRREGVAGDRQRGPDQQGAERQHRPIDRESQGQGPRLGDEVIASDWLDLSWLLSK